MYSSKELGLPRRKKKIGVEVDLNINYVFKIYSLLGFFNPYNRNLLSAWSLPHTMLGRRGSKMIAAQHLPQGVHCTVLPKGPSLARACASAVVRALPAKVYPFTEQTSRSLPRAGPDWLIILRSSRLLCPDSRAHHT